MQRSRALGYGRRMRRLVCIAGLIVLCLSGSAEAGTLSSGGFSYVADPGEANRVIIDYDPLSDRYSFTDTGSSQIKLAFPDNYIGVFYDCTFEGPQRFTCEGDAFREKVFTFFASLGDRNDTIAMGAGMYLDPKWEAGGGFGAHFYGNGGDDLLDAAASAGGMLMGDLDFDHLNDAEGVPVGDDVIIGSRNGDMIIGGPGDDVMLGKGGKDGFDWWAFGREPMQGEAGEYAAIGSDYMDGGPGSDTFNGLEYTSRLEVNGQKLSGEEPDVMRCGSGDEADPPGMTPGFLPPPYDEMPGDAVALGARDTVLTDCEGVVAGVKCPDNADDDCYGTTAAGGTSSSSSGRSASPAAKRTKRGYIVFGSGRFKVTPGRTAPIRINLRRKRVEKVLGARSAAGAKLRFRARSGKRKLKLRAIRFKIARPD